MTGWTDATLTSWGRTRFAHVAALAPRDDDGVREALQTGNGRGIIAYGGGRCYGDAALDDGGRTLLTRNLDRILSFDETTREAVCEAGVTFRALADAFFERGYCFPVSAATSSVTIGGAVANDIHSKNHHALGSFGDHALWIDLTLADGRVVRCSRGENTDLFRATLGGAGLTGAILRVAFRLLKVESGAVDVRYERIADADAMIDTIDAARGEEDFLFGWVDMFARGAALGRGILEKGRFAPHEAGALPAPKPKSVPFAPPTQLLLPHLLRRYTNRRFEGLPIEGRAVRLRLFPFLFPIDHISGFNRLYGHRGFYSIHAGFPRASQRDGIRAMLRVLAGAQAGFITAVMKPMRGPGEGLLSFPLDGMAFAADLPRRNGVEALHRRIEGIVLDHGGRLYIAKDALMTADGFTKMFPRLDEFRAVLARIDPQGRFQSDLSRRLRIRNS